MGLLVLFVVPVVPAAAVRRVRGTRLFWLPGTVLLLGAGALYLYGISIPIGHDAPGALDALAAGLADIGAWILFAYGLLCLVLAARAPRTSMPPPAVPEASVVRDPWHRD